MACRERLGSAVRAARKGGAMLTWFLVAILGVAVGWTLLNAKFGASVRR
jgi:hypothetical protein